MPYTKVWLHIVWATKQKMPLLTKDMRQKLFAHIKENALSKGLLVDCVNGHIDHVHVLVCLGADQSVSKILQFLKTESSFWVNKHGLTKSTLEWQDDYFAVSVSQSAIDMVKSYIKNQEMLHQKKTFQQEYDEFMEKFGFVLMKG